MKFSKVLLFALSFFMIATSFTIMDKVFPSIDLKDLSGKKVSTDSFVKDGKVTVVSFFAVWCKPCQLEMDNIAEVYPEWREKYDVEMVSISVDDARGSAKLNALISSKDWEYTMLKDEKQELQRVLGFQTIPQTFLLDQDGKIIYSHSGYKAGDEIELEDHIMEAVGK